ncbi:glycosyltransferase family 2 protein [Schaalia sp. 19OD2882]|uniref:glycosyltransferase family 2 protein n=1 Tax=Schaalia sp. 19OD2882 TaxID=2794089 RepID=UPI001C1EA652|nr:glycosyltransferase family 2 protein [Schaalia sp. 19OD2882]QWW20289.1 glycosyltransferase family 2 protein [Schaalia sp. 19OD2882]
MSTTPTVTIVTRTKDRAILLDRAIRDVIAQTFEDFEMVIVNDGGRPEEVDALVAKYADGLKGRARVIHNPESTGMEHASNQAITSSTGRYICIHDDDDTWAPSFLQTCTAHLEANPELGGVAVRTEIVLEKLTANSVQEIGRMPAWPEIHQFSLSRLVRSNIAVPISCMYPRKVIEDLGGFRSDLPVVGDWEFHIRLAVAYDVAFIDGKPLAFWHQRRQQKGVLGNSVFAGAKDHAYFDLKVRDEYLRDYVRRNGIGALLWQAAVFEDMRHSSQTFFSWANWKVRRVLSVLRKR